MHFKYKTEISSKMCAAVISLIQWKAVCFDMQMVAPVTQILSVSNLFVLFARKMLLMLDKLTALYVESIPVVFI